MIATYRLQLRPSFDFDDAAALVPYLRRLGVSHLYLSPITEAREGSTHGYDVVDHNAVRAELGGRAGFERLRRAAYEAGLGLVLDFVPNHAGVGPHNDAWQDVLAYGPHAAHASTFDIDWTPLKPELYQKILLPFLGDAYGTVLDGGQITVAYDDGRFYAAYYDQRFALAPHTYVDLLTPLLEQFERTDTYWDLKDLADDYQALDPDARDKAEALRSRLAALGSRLDEDAFVPALSTAALHALLERQYWRLAYWKTAGSEINYRRFFDINELVALRVEAEPVFWERHRLLGELLALDGVDGVRIDHVDGLYDPHQYLRRLREAGARHVWVEKIMAPGETLPEGWPVEGATGYAFLNDAMGVLLDPDGEAAIEQLYRRVVPRADAFDEVAWDAKRLVMNTTLNSELARLAYELDRLSESDYHTRDFTLEALRAALEDVVAAFDRYRTYLPYEAAAAAAIVEEVVQRARRHSSVSEPSVFDFILDVLRGDVREDLADGRRAWVGRLQQYTAPVAAKGVEDTAFYRYVPLVALCEVGGEPEPFGCTREAFHERAAYQATHHPRGLLTVATHDHKRGPETRMRLIALAQHTDAWSAAVGRLEEEAGGTEEPAAPDRYLLYQILVALWRDADGTLADREALADRVVPYMQKAAREAKRYTTWSNPDANYEDALESFVRRLLEAPSTAEALDDLSGVLARDGLFNSLSQRVLQLTAPGVPDLYQGAELPDLSLVDPDNRRPVDYARRRDLLDGLADLLAAPRVEPLEAMWAEAEPRLLFYVTACLLQLRNDHEQLFAEGRYEALAPEGPAERTWLAFTRVTEREAVLVVVGRFPAGRDAPPGASLALPEALAGRSWHDALTGATYEDAGGRFDLEQLPLPWAVLTSTAPAT